MGDPMSLGAGMAISAGIGLLPSLFSKGKVGVPGSMARPTDPTLKFVNEDGTMKDQFKTGGLDNESLAAGRGILGDLRTRATMEGPTKSAQYLQGANQLNAQAQRDQGANDRMSSLATNQANMAMKGGLGSGASERMASSNNYNAMMQGQDINRGQAQNNMNILANDESQKLGILQDLPGQYQSFGNELMGRQVGDTQGGMNLLMNKYGADMQAYGANQMSRAQAQGQNASSKGLLSGFGL